MVFVCDVPNEAWLKKTQELSILPFNEPVDLAVDAAFTRSSSPEDAPRVVLRIQGSSVVHGVARVTSGCALLQLKSELEKWSGTRRLNKRRPCRLPLLSPHILFPISLSPTKRTTEPTYRRRAHPRRVQGAVRGPARGARRRAARACARRPAARRHGHRAAGRGRGGGAASHPREGRGTSSMSHNHDTTRVDLRL